ncbi:MAG TPA: hypothetical protein VFY13_01125, partial [Luteolibacter sp.]|nr:hypothetical protein [Luteolibacter sp.]
MGKHLKIFNAVAAAAILLIVLYAASYWVIFRMHLGSMLLPSWDDPFLDTKVEYVARKAFVPAAEVDDWFTIHRPTQKYLRGYWVREGGEGGDDFVEILPDG